MENVQIITIPVHTDIDPATLLEIVISLAAELEDQIESYGSGASIREEEISVEDGDDIYGSENEYE